MASPVGPRCSARKCEHAALALRHEREATHEIVEEIRGDRAPLHPPCREFLPELEEGVECLDCSGYMCDVQPEPGHLSHERRWTTKRNVQAMRAHE